MVDAEFQSVTGHKPSFIVEFAVVRVGNFWHYTVHLTLLTDERCIQQPTVRQLKWCADNNNLLAAGCRYLRHCLFARRNHIVIKKQVFAGITADTKFRKHNQCGCLYLWLFQLVKNAAGISGRVANFYRWRDCRQSQVTKFCIVHACILSPKCQNAWFKLQPFAFATGFTGSAESAPNHGIPSGTDNKLPLQSLLDGN